MRSDVASRGSKLLRGYGTVKWFGGLNNNTGRENHFGFIEDLNGKDVFLHKGDWRGKSQPEEGQLVTYLKEERNGKFSARQAESLDTSEILASEWYLALCTSPQSKRVTSNLQRAIEEKLRQSLTIAAPEDLRQLFQVSQRPGALSIFGLVASGIDAVKNYAVLMEATGLRITDSAPWAGLSRRVASHFEAEIAVNLGSVIKSTR